MIEEVSIINSGFATPSGPSTQSAALAPGAWSDWVGMIASIGCAIHCAAMPFVIAYLPALGLSFLADEAFHKWMAVGCFIIALAAFVPGLRLHGRLTPVIVASFGLTMISIAAFGFAGECCPSCEVAATPVAANDAAVCTDANCPHCASEDPAAAESAAESSTVAEVPLASDTAPSPAPESWGGQVVPWLTPIGGIVLVSAHLLNRRYGCLCGCCGDEPSDEGA